MSIFDEMKSAVRQADATMRAADYVANDMASLLDGRLKKVSPWILKRLKRQLRDFNIHTGEWKQ